MMASASPLGALDGKDLTKAGLRGDARPRRQAYGMSRGRSRRPIRPNQKKNGPCWPKKAGAASGFPRMVKPWAWKPGAGLLSVSVRRRRVRTASRVTAARSCPAASLAEHNRNRPGKATRPAVEGGACDHGACGGERLGGSARQSRRPPPPQSKPGCQSV